MLVIGDADALVALCDPLDELHTSSNDILEKLAEKKAKALFPITAVCEAVRVLQCKPVKRGGKKVVRPEEAKFLVEIIQSGVIPLLPINQEILAQALKMYEEEELATTLKNTLFDAIIATIAKQTHAYAIFGFDSWYGRMELKSGYELLQE